MGTTGKEKQWKEEKQGKRGRVKRDKREQEMEGKGTVGEERAGWGEGKKGERVKLETEKQRVDKGLTTNVIKK